MRTARVLGLFALAATLFVFVVGSSGCSDDTTQSDASHDGPSADADGGGRDIPADSGPLAVRIPGLSAPVGAVYDEHGILHLSCKTDGDCMAALGYFHAYNRLFFMDLLRTLMRGRLASWSVAGQAALDSDFPIRHLTTTADGTPIEEQAIASLDTDARALLDRYSAGVNAYLADLRDGKNGAKLTGEYSVPLFDQKRVIPDWEPEDCVAIGMYLVNSLANTINDELDAAEVASKVTDSDLMQDLLSLKPPFDAYISQDAGITFSLHHPKIAVDYLKNATLAVQKARRYIEPLRVSRNGRGSNNWIVGKELTSGDKSLLANDPHLPLTNPAIWFPVEIDSKSDGSGTLHVAGGTVAGVPLVLVGRNEKLAWGMTTVFYDQNEVYLEQLNADGTAVMFNGQEVKITTKEFTFKDASTGKDVKKTFEYVPHHGPLLSKDLTNKTAVSVRWIPATGFTDVTSLINLMRTEKVSDLPAALAKLTSTDQNVVAVDDQGNIGWFPYSKLPDRTWASLTTPPWLPVKGDGSAEWASFLPMSDLPQGQNPPNHFVVTANNATTNATADGDPTNDGKASLAYQAIYKADGARAKRITDLIKAGGTTHDVASMLEIQSDVYSLIGERVTPAVLAAAQGKTLDADSKKVIDALTNWDFTCPTGLAGTDPKGPKDSDQTKVTESIGCTAFHFLYGKIVAIAFDDEQTKYGVKLPSVYRSSLILRAIAAPTSISSNFWDDVSTASTTETMNDTLLKAVAAAAKALTTQLDPSSSEWIWGRIHTLSLRSPLDSFGVRSFNSPEYANDGGLSTVDVGNPFGYAKDGTFDARHGAGASTRLVFEAGGGNITMKMQLPGGTDLHTDSPRYNQLLDKYLRNEPIDFHFGKGSVTSPSETVDVAPAK